MRGLLTALVVIYGLLVIPLNSYIQPLIIMAAIPFGGLSPMIFETSRQARFLIPMALSLGYGILFATVITLILVPSFYLIVEDLIILTGIKKMSD